MKATDHSRHRVLELLVFALIWFSRIGTVFGTEVTSTEPSEWSCTYTPNDQDIVERVCNIESSEELPRLPQVNKVKMLLRGNRHEYDNDVLSFDRTYWQSSIQIDYNNDENIFGSFPPSNDSSPSNNIDTFSVDNPYDDYQASTNYCMQLSAKCNLRSAWLSCTTITSSCKIILPEHSEIYVNKTYAALLLKSVNNIELVGRNTTIMSVGLPLDSAIQFINNASFPLSTQNFTDTNSAQQNYNSTCLMACPGQQVNISTCSSQTKGDTFIRLYLGNTEISSNDDFCGLKSQIIYNIPLSAQCEQYCVHLGCYGTSSCSMYVVASIAPSISPQLITYAQQHGDPIPSLTIHNTTIEGFGAEIYEGGALSLAGNIDLTLSYSLFWKNAASQGSTLYLSGNTAKTHIHHCVIHEYAGGIYIEGNSSNTIIERVFSSGGIYFAGANLHSNIMIRDSIIYEGPIYIGDAIAKNVTLRNLDVISPENSFLYLVQRVTDVTVMNISIHPTYTSGEWTDDNNILYDDDSYDFQFYPYISTFYIGPDSMNIHIDNISVFCNNLASGPSDAGDANIVTIKSASSINITNFSINKCFATQELIGGMISLVNAKDITLDSIWMNEVVSTLMGGGIFLQYSQYVTIQNSHFEACQSGDSGGGIALYSGNSNIQILDTMITRSQVPHFGGGIFLGADNNYVTIAGCTISLNSAKDSGGGIFLSQTNYQFAILDSRAYQNFTTLETSHPYIVPYTYQGFSTIATTVIYQQYVEIADATEYILNFDSATQFQTELAIIITIGRGQDIYFSTFSSDRLPGIAAPSLRILLPAFTFQFVVPNAKTPITTGLYGVKAYVYPCFPVSLTKPTLVLSNTARKAGGLLLYYANQFSVLLNLHITNNSAISGGGMVYQNGNVGGVVQQAVISQNRAGVDGGGLVIQSGQFGMSFRGCSFESNEAGLDGGAIYFGSSNGVGVLVYGNVIRFTSSTFFNNSAITGGAVFAADDVTMVFANSTFNNNKALKSDGGALYLGQACYVNFSASSWFINNHAAYRGGVIFSSEGNLIAFMNSSYFVSNYAGSVGGAIVLFNSSIMVLQSGISWFESNAAGFGGGAIVISTSPMWVPVRLTSTIFINNTAPRGSVLFIYNLAASVGSVSFPNAIVNTSFIGNVAAIGGTIYWIYDVVLMKSEPRVHHKSNLWVDNVAGYGNITATQAVSLHSPRQYDVTVYGAYLTPGINITLYDYYNQLVTVTGDTAIASSINHFNCTTYPFLSGPDMFDNGVAMLNSSASFNQLQASCSPNGWIEVKFTAQLGILVTAFTGTASSGNVIQSYYIRNTTIFNFRGCLAGEYETKGECQVCQVSTFNLKPNSASCSSCTNIQGVESCQGNQLVLKQGYWRRYLTSSAVQACLLDPISCTGGTAVGNQACSTGYEGPLCAVCSAGFFESNNQCIECTDSAQITPAMIALVVLIFLSAIFSFLVYRALKKLNKNKKQEENSQQVDHNQPDSDDEQPDRDDIDQNSSRPLPTSGTNGDEPPSTIALIYWWMREKYDDIIVRLKIVVSTFQVISSSASVFSISFPLSFSVFTNGLKFFNIGLYNLFPIGCTGQYNFVATVLWTTLGPIALSVFMLILFLFEFAWLRHKIRKNNQKNKKKGLKKKLFNETKSKYLNYFFYLTYLVLPSVTTTLFQWFICTTIDPQNEDQDRYDWFLTADMSISCQSDYYRHWTIYVIVMIMIYPVGIPSLYLYLLNGHKEEIMNRAREEKENEITIGELNPSMSLSKRNDSVISAASNAEQSNRDDSREREVDEELAVRKDMSFSYVTRAKDMEALEDTEASTATQENEQENSKTMSVTAQRLSFLWQAYEPKYWYWEVIETTRKLMLTAVLSVCAPGSSQQSVLGVLMSYAYIRLYGYYRPYDEKAEDVLAETGQMQILMTFFVALVLQNSLLDSGWDYTLGLMLTMINMSIVVLTCYYEIVNYHAAVKEAQEREAVLKQKRLLKRIEKRLEFAHKAGAAIATNAGNISNPTAAKTKFKKMSADDLQSLDERAIKERLGKDAIDSDDEEFMVAKNILHGNRSQSPLKVKTSGDGDIELRPISKSLKQNVNQESNLPSGQQQFHKKLNIHAQIDSDDEN